MQGLKKNSLSAWLMHPKNKVMDASLGSSGNADKRDNSVELTSGAYDDAIYESISPSKLTTASSEVLSNANTALTELTAASSARFQMANTTLTELAAGKPTADGPTTEICDQSKVKKVTYAESCNESSKIKRIVYLIISSFTFRLRIVLRPVRLVILIRVFHLAHQKRHLEMLTRRMVSGNKRRYKKDGFDLDLTYVTERIIAMSFPSSGKQSFYRNPIKEVVRFLDTKHPNHYQVYNLCSERAYDPKYFHHRVHRYLIDDHNVPSLSEMLAFSMEVKEWMAQDKDNIIVVHCKGGKGRTGTMVCAYLLASEIFATAEDSLYYFGERRTDKSTSSKFQGIETPSQNRFVGYFAMVKNIYNLTLPPIKKLTIKKIVIYSIHGVGKGNGHDLKVQIIMQRKTVFFCSASKNCRIFHDAETDRVILLLSKCPPLYDEVKVKFFSSSALPKYYENCAFFFWFHMSFIRNNRLYLSRSELDNPHKIKAWKAYSPQFAVEVYFDDI
ncbi:phosphatidylinositol 3,4,5-trisphosphate 3-phosphatase TPTE2-like isoform X13 [Bubalus kerabau]|uniref:phosphatidylinositol 3,4,5-trisphosphate 3-phosphatase TPTE2 isoform X16 n=1 Tax=Bubalus bubalis TaxID=89462 RepID=UPI001E1B8B82|nr:phosphatidylinositol 3,4,5-trisphosphate 3-phosphatase TPTE2 isoform X16 [Bubalus bubalis]XP_055398238.1 phosphatidylinositol 3,4,5-trisphosphate 3-phosphatase TPTE2-like isoform X13 [Bubalus carabanensis]